MTFERKVAVVYLARLLVGDGARELGAERCVVSVAFQQAPEHPVDDVVVTAARPDEADPSLVLALAIRRVPNLVASDEATQKLIRDFVQGVVEVPTDGPEHRFGLVVSGPQKQATELASLADVAGNQLDAAVFFDLIRTPEKFTARIRGRLDHFEELVKQALTDLGGSEPTTDLVQQRTWELLSRLAILMPRLETPDPTDWDALLKDLNQVARGGDLGGASRLRDRLIALAGEYAPSAATVNLRTLRRDAYTALDISVRRNERGWRVLEHLGARAVSSVRSEIGAPDDERRLRLDRHELAGQVLATANSGTAVVVSGESGVGKSALVLGSVTTAASDDESDTQVACVNLRHLPSTTIEFESLLGSPLEELLAELSAPNRLLVIDGADAVAEGQVDQLRYLVDAAYDAGVGLIVTTSFDNKQAACEVVGEQFGKLAETVVPLLTDAEIDEVAASFEELVSLAHNQKARELLRRPVVIDLLVRGRVSGVPLSDADAMEQVWTELVRRPGWSGRGTRMARDLAMLRLAGLELAGGDRLEAVEGIDAEALDGLCRDGLLRSPVENPFGIGPEFAHDEVRRYAVARLLLAEADPTTKLVEAAVPRWALGAARLACQRLLVAPDAPGNPVRGRFARLQAAFDALVGAGHGERWGDVPGEALLTLGDPEPMLRDAWATLRSESQGDLKRLCRLIDQRLRDENHLLRLVAVEPVVELLLDDEAPWKTAKHVQDIVLDWLRAHVFAGTAEGHPLRVRLREQLVAACSAADQRLQAAQAAAAAARAARSPEEIEQERRFRESHRALFTEFTEIGSARSQRPLRPEVPREITDSLVIELLALLGPDLGDDGEAILRRVGRDSPSDLAPAVDDLVAGRALAMSRRGILAELTETYYVDEDEDGSVLHEDGIRDHSSRNFGVVPLSSPYRGPFIPLFQADMAGGVSVLNRMLNHAALARARTLAKREYGYGAPNADGNLDAYRTVLDVAGVRRTYVGDAHVWNWYRGTGVGPHPCMSALQALERVCDQFIEIGIPIDRIVARLLRNCENLAMVGFVVGLLVRHMERAGRLLDPYLADPRVWKLEFGRASSELMNGLAAPSGDLVGAERRSWSMREVAMHLVVRADDARASELRGVGEQLIANARRLASNAPRDGRESDEDEALQQELTTVRAWASTLDRDTYRMEQAEDGVYIQSVPPEEIVEALERASAAPRRTQDAMRLASRYALKPKMSASQSISADELVEDLTLARSLLEDSPGRSVLDPWDAAAAVASTALSAHLTRNVALSDDWLRFSVDTVLRVGAGEVPAGAFEGDDVYFEQGAERSAARALPLLLLPSALPLLSLVDSADDSSSYERVIGTGLKLAQAVAFEVRLHLARGMDRVWQETCREEGGCHHEVALWLVVESMRHCVMGTRDAATGERTILPLEDPVETSLAELGDDEVYVSRLGAAIRALAPAAVAHVCVSSRARELLDVALAAQRRSLLTYERDVDHQGTQTLIAARAVLTLASDGDEVSVFQYIDAYADSPRLLGGFLRALSSTAEENAQRAAAAQRVWPRIVEHVLELREAGRKPFEDDFVGELARAALLPNAGGGSTYLYRELDGDPIEWWQPIGWRDVVDQWLRVAAGSATCVDQLIGFLSVLPMNDQVRHGLPWVASLVLPQPERVAGRTFLLSEWLIKARTSARDAGLLSDWQRVIDALVVAGASKLAPYSE
ncbi:MAG: ATP-binding protein [Trueperaceae bacterium]|nr:ATP-binding protein [Trueperaceae bacterium]